MGKKRTVSIIISVVIGAMGVFFVYNFFISGNGGVFDFVLGSCLLFLAIYNMILTLKSSKK